MTASGTSVEFYDKIASEYDQKMEDDKPNQKVRSQVKAYFLDQVDSGLVLDFGAGTGLDLEWQLAAGYRVVFYEPSSNMARHAEVQHGISENPNIRPLIGAEATIDNLRMLEDHSLNAVFSNFAALNSVEDLGKVFAVFTKKLKPGGHLICVMTHNFNWVDRVKSILKNIIAGSPNSVAKTVTMDSGHSMKVHYHSRHAIKAYGHRNGLRFKNEFPLGFEGHRLSHFIK